MSGPGSLRWHASRTERTVSRIIRWTMWEKSQLGESYFFFSEDSVVITLLTFRVRTAKQKQLMGGASRRGASRLAVHGESTRLFLLSYWSSGIKPVIHLTTQTLTPSEPPIRMEERLIGQWHFQSHHVEMFSCFHWLSNESERVSCSEKRSFYIHLSKTGVICSYL